LGKGDSAKLKFGVFKIGDETYLKTTDAEVVQHLTDFMIGNARNGFRIDDHFPESDEVRNEFADLDFPMMNRKARLLEKVNFLMPELNHERVLIHLLMKPMPHRIQNGKCTADHPLCLQNMNLFSYICVHPVHLRFIFFYANNGP